MTAEPTEPRPIAAWMKMLDQIESTLERQMASVRELESPPGDKHRPTSTPLQALDDHLTQVQARLDQVDREAVLTDAALRMDSEAYQRWRETMTATRRNLADWAGRVG